MFVPTTHRPWQLPVRGWGIFMRWHDLMFMHWDVAASVLRPLIPAGLQLDTFAGRAWLGVVPFRMSGIRHRYMPPLPGLSAFPELNVRTYVTAGGKAGVWFFSLDATSKIAVRTARLRFHLNYYDANIRCAKDSASTPERPQINYHSQRVHRGAPPAALDTSYGPTGDAFSATPGTVEHFLTERYCLYAADRTGTIYRGEISHLPWSLRNGEADIRGNSMATPLGVSIDGPPLLHYAADQDVIAWTNERIGA